MAVAVGFGAVLGIGFWWQPRPEWGVVGGVAVVVISLGVAFPLLGVSPWEELGRWWRGRSRKATVFPAARRDEWAKQVGYEVNLGVTATCEHLVAVERSMRRAGLEARLLPESEWGPVIKVVCRINFAGLQRAFSLPEFVVYEERYQPERYEFDNPRADVICGKCREAKRRSGILVLHPDECGADTRWFPSSPSIDSE